MLTFVIPVKEMANTAKRVTKKTARTELAPRVDLIFFLFIIIFLSRLPSVVGLEGVEDISGYGGSGDGSADAIDSDHKADFDAGDSSVTGERDGEDGLIEFDGENIINHGVGTASRRAAGVNDSDEQSRISRIVGIGNDAITGISETATGGIDIDGVVGEIDGVEVPGGTDVGGHLIEGIAGGDAHRGDVVIDLVTAQGGVEGGAGRGKEHRDDRQGDQNFDEGQAGVSAFTGISFQGETVCAKKARGRSLVSHYTPQRSGQKVFST